MLNAPGVVEDYLRLLIGTKPYEVFVYLYLDARHQLLHAEKNRRAGRGLSAGNRASGAHAQRGEADRRA
ncbi:MAG: DNA repair protein RadC [uncultured Caballeronia sp.]|nr:MAG: DNA repair protein RadC [uncultured Caballeronia sp.]